MLSIGHHELQLRAKHPGGKKLLRQHPFDQIFNGSRVLGINDLVLFFGAVLKLDRMGRCDVLDAFFHAVSLALVFG